jgi:hypothetical protein
MDGRTDISIERIQMNLEVEHIVRQRRWLGPHREPAAVVRPLQLGKGRPATEISSGPIA